LAAGGPRAELESVAGAVNHRDAVDRDAQPYMARARDVGGVAEEPEARDVSGAPEAEGDGRARGVAVQRGHDVDHSGLDLGRHLVAPFLEGGRDEARTDGLRQQQAIADASASVG